MAATAAALAPIRTGGAAFPYGPTPALLVLLPVLALVHLALFVTMMAMMISLVNTGTILSWHLPAEIPPWAGVLILLAGYQVVVSPIRAANWWSCGRRPAGRRSGLPSGMPSSGWWGWPSSSGLPRITSPEIREFLQRFPDMVRQFVDAIRDVFAR